MKLSLSIIFKSESTVSKRTHFRNVLNPFTLFWNLNTNLEVMSSSLGVLNVSIHKFPIYTEFNRKNICADLKKEALNLKESLKMSENCKMYVLCILYIYSAAEFQKL